MMKISKLRGLSQNTVDFAQEFEIIYRKYTELFRSLGNTIVDKYL